MRQDGALRDKKRADPPQGVQSVRTKKSARSNTPKTNPPQRHAKPAVHGHRARHEEDEDDEDTRGDEEDEDDEDDERRRRQKKHLQKADEPKKKKKADKRKKKRASEPESDDSDREDVDEEDTEDDSDAFDRKPKSNKYAPPAKRRKKGAEKTGEVRRGILFFYGFAVLERFSN